MPAGSPPSIPAQIVPPADAYLHIKYHVATYESCMRPSRVARKP